MGSVSQPARQMSSSNGNNRIADLQDGVPEVLNPSAEKVPHEQPKKVRQINIVKFATEGQRKAMAVLEANLRDAQQAYMAANKEWGPAGARYHADGYWFTVDQ